MGSKQVRQQKVSNPVQQPAQRGNAPGFAASATSQLARCQSLLEHSPGLLTQQKTIQAIADSPRQRTSQLKKPPGSQQPVIQAKVMVDNKPARMLNKTTAFVNGEPIALGSRDADWVNDGYHRSYKSNSEFKAHMGGAPVDVGLSKKLGRWYRLPFFSEKRFFVLGENHGAFGYRELIEESNQPGKVLGEGGSNALHSATSDSPLAPVNNGLKNEQGESRESIMENISPKSYFGMSMLRDYCQKVLDRRKEKETMVVSSEESVKKAPEKKKLPETEWLANYQSSKPEDRKTGEGLNKVPYYVDRDGNHVYATLNTKAENYSGIATAGGVIKKLHDAISVYLDSKKGNTKGLGGLILIQDLLSEAILINSQGKVDYEKLRNKLDELLPWVEKLSLAEIQKFDATPDEALKARGKKVEENLEYEGHNKRSFAMRDYVMLKSILKARRDHVMAGIGDNHAANLAEDLQKENVKVVRFDDFVGPGYSIDALAPVEETVPGHQQLVEDADFEKDSFLESIYSRLIKQNFGKFSLALPQHPLTLSPSLRGLLRSVALSNSFRTQEVVAPRLMNEFKQIVLRPENLQGGDDKLMLPSTGKKKTLTFDISKLTQMRDTLADFYIAPPSMDKESGGKELMVVGQKGPSGFSMASVFDQFAILAQMAGTFDIDPGVPLMELFGKLLLQIQDAKSQALVPESHSRRADLAAQELLKMLQTNGLGNLSLKDINQMVQAGKKKKHSTAITM